MATGVEAAGLVLAAFPLLVSAAEHYREGFEKIQEWYHFRPEFTAFCHAIDIQRALFDGNLEELLVPLVVSDTEMNTLLQDPGGLSWLDLEDRLRDRLPRSYTQYRVTMDEMNIIMEKLLKTQFGIEQKISVPSFSLPEGRIDFEKKRIKFTLRRRKREKLLEALSKHNSDLRQLLHSSDRVILTKSRRKPSHAQCQKTQKRACTLYTTIAEGWRCRCSATHDTKLLLQKRLLTTAIRKPLADSTDSLVDTFGVLFTFQARFKAHEAAPWKWQQVNVKVEEHVGSNDEALPQISRLQIDKPLPAVPGTLPTAEASQAASTRRVTFAAAPCVATVPEPSRANSREIHDLCSALQHMQREEQCLGFLLDQQRQRHEIYPLAKAHATSDTGETVTLENILTSQSQPWSPDENSVPPRLTRRERMSLAVTLASSAIELLNTPWLGRDWNKKYIAFLKARRGSPRSIAVEQPYVSQSQSRTMDPQPLDSMTSTIFSLGVMLLELWFGEALEDQPFRSQYLGPDGCATDFTDLSTAAVWHRQILEDAGPQLSEAIRSCIFWSFRPQASGSAETELREAMFTEVLQPLERISRAFVETAF